MLVKLVSVLLQQLKFKPVFLLTVQLREIVESQY